MIYCIYHLHQIYVFEIYTLTYNCTVLYTLQVAHIVIPKTILNFTSVICHEMSQYDMCRCRFLILCVYMYKVIFSITE